MAGVLPGRTLIQIALSGSRSTRTLSTSIVSPKEAKWSSVERLARDHQVDNCAQLSTGFNCTVPPAGARETARMLRLSQMKSSLNLRPLRLSAPLLLKLPEDVLVGLHRRCRWP